MKKTGIFAAVLLSAILTVGVPAQDTAKKETPVKPAASPSQAVLEAWNDVGRKLIAMAEDFPEDKYDFKATPAQRSFAENLLHTSNANYFFTNIARGEKPPAEEDPKREQYKTKADVVAFVKKAFADGADVIKAKDKCHNSSWIPSPTSRSEFPILPTGSSSITESTTANSWSITVCRAWCHRNHVRRSKEGYATP